MSRMNRETYIALQMACELRQVITDELNGMPELGIPADCYPLPPFDGETFDSACKRIFGDYIYTKVMSERKAAEGLPEKFRGYKPKGPKECKPVRMVRWEV